MKYLQLPHTETTDEFKIRTQGQASQTFQQTLPGRRQTEEKEANKDTLKTISHQGNVNQSHTELPLKTQNGMSKTQVWWHMRNCDLEDSLG